MNTPRDVARFASADRAELADLAPLLRRVIRLDPVGLVRLVRRPGRLAAYVHLPFDVLAARTVATPNDPSDRAAELTDRTVAAADLLSWLDGEATTAPAARDAEWRGALPPADGWLRVDSVPDSVIRGLVRAGALTLAGAADREGVPGAQPRADVADALLDSVVLTVSDERGHHAEVTLRAVSALTRMGFLPRDSHAAVDVAGRWTRVAGAYGSVYGQARTMGLSLAPAR